MIPLEVEEPFVIRPYLPEDRQALRIISCDTAFVGGQDPRFTSDREILADILTGYFTASDATGMPVAWCSTCPWRG